MGNGDTIHQQGNFVVGVSKGTTTVHVTPEFFEQIDAVVRAIDDSHAPLEDKRKIKTLLKRFLENPTVAATLGAIAARII